MIGLFDQAFSAVVISADLGNLLSVVAEGQVFDAEVGSGALGLGGVLLQEQ